MNNQMNSAGSLYARNLNVVKTYFRKPLSLVIAILSVAVLVLDFIVNSRNTENIQKLAEFLNMPSDQVPSSGGSNIISYLIMGVVIICFFMIYFISKNSNPSSSPAPFFTVLHVFSIIELIVVAIATIGVIVLAVSFMGMGSSLITSLVDQYPELFAYDDIENILDSFKVTILIIFALIVVIMAIGLFYINAQTAFLKSCIRSCKEPSLHSKGAKAYSILSVVMAVLMLVGLVIVFMFTSGLSNDSSVTGNSSDYTLITTQSLILKILTAIRLILLGTLASGYVKHIDENKDYAYAAAAAATRSPEVNPIATYTSNTRASNNAAQQSQPYLYGEEENKDPNKKSSYIPEELQQDYQQPQNDPFMQPQNPYGAPMQFDPQYGGQPDPFMQPMQPQDPFAQSPIGNSYGQPIQNPNSQNPYNNGMM